MRLINSQTEEENTIIRRKRQYSNILAGIYSLEISTSVKYSFSKIQVLPHLLNVPKGCNGQQAQ
jgi:hypothetical protein